jgi:hypothetical protein
MKTETKKKQVKKRNKYYYDYIVYVESLPYFDKKQEYSYMTYHEYFLMKTYMQFRNNSFKNIIKVWSMPIGMSKYQIRIIVFLAVYYHIPVELTNIIQSYLYMYISSESSEYTLFSYTQQLQRIYEKDVVNQGHNMHMVL